VNVRVGPFLVDFLWHRDRGSFESDRARDAELAVQGHRVLRFTYRQVIDQPARVAATVRRLLRS